MNQHMLVIAALACAFSSSPAGAQVLLTFDDLGTGPLSTQYQAKGATFNSPLVRDYSPTPGFTHSGKQGIELCFAAEFCTAALNVSFTTGEKHVKVFVGFTSQLGQASPVSMRALDANGATVAQQTVMLGPSAAAIPVQVPLEVTSAAANIGKSLSVSRRNTFNNGLVLRFRIRCRRTATRVPNTGESATHADTAAREHNRADQRIHAPGLGVRFHAAATRQR